MQDEKGRPPGGNRLLIFSRYPRAGHTKTRLIPSLGAEAAAALQQRLTEHTLRTVSKAGLCGDCEIHYTGAGPDQMTQWLGSSIPLHQQAAGSLGEKMSHAAGHSFAAGYRQVVIIGIDCPGLSADDLRHAFSLLADTDLVIGPAADGGYYLLGMRNHAPAIFRNIPWGTGNVLETTLTAARNIGLTFSLLPIRSDIDRPADLNSLPFSITPEVLIRRTEG